MEYKKKNYRYYHFAAHTYYIYIDRQHSAIYGSEEDDGKKSRKV